MDLAVLGTMTTLLIAAVAAYFAFLQARSAAKPRIVISLLDSRAFSPGEEVRLTVNLRNRPYLYAAPTARNVCAFVNVDPIITPLTLRFGSALSNVDAQVKVGKNNSRYLQATGIMLLPGQSESLELHAKMPTIEGRYRFWLDVLADEGANATFRTRLEVRG